MFVRGNTAANVCMVDCDYLLDLYLFASIYVLLYENVTMRVYVQKGGRKLKHRSFPHVPTLYWYGIAYGSLREYNRC